MGEWTNKYGIGDDIVVNDDDDDGDLWVAMAEESRRHPRDIGRAKVSKKVCASDSSLSSSLSVNA